VQDAAEVQERALRLLWSSGDRPARGPRRGLTVDAIVAAAIELVSTEGLAALSMRQVATKLGVGTASLYTYLPGKAELAALMLDAIMADAPLPHELPGDWRAKLAAWARDDWAAYRDNPWVLELAAVAAAPGPRMLRWLDSAIQALDGTGLTDAEKLAVIESVDGYVRGLATLRHRGGADATPDEVERRDAALGELVDFDRYPTLQRALVAGTKPYAADQFEFGLERLLDGIAALIRSRRPRRRPRTAGEGRQARLTHRGHPPCNMFSIDGRASRLGKAAGAFTSTRTCSIFEVWPRPSVWRGATMWEYKELYLGGQWAAPATDRRIHLVSPHSEQPLGSTPEAGEQDVDRAVSAARRAFDAGEWPRTDPVERLAAVRRFAAAYTARQEELAELISTEMGAPLWFSYVGQVGATAMALDALLAIAEGIDWEECRVGSFGGQVMVRREPVGVVGVITPWNVPHFVTVAKLVPALLAGCPVVLKPAPETPVSGLVLAEILDEAGLPDGVVSVLPAGREVGEHLVRHPGVDKIAFTGSTAAGRRIAALCGQDLRRVTLELGGKSAAIVLDDADLGQVVQGLQMAALMNSGQACIAQTRILAPRRRYDEVVEALAAMVAGLSVGDPLNLDNYIGPMVARRQQDRVQSYIRAGQEDGARLVVGGTGMPDGLHSGWYVRPTLFASVDNGMRIAREEIFGPVLCVIPYEDEEDAVRIANDSDYGLAGSVWTSDVAHGLDVARRVRSGSLAVNQYLLDFNAPFGGFKASGIGREFGPEGFDAYVDLKSVALPIGNP
jgi:aldehyde dehydrogenase (NAD+)